MERKSHVCMVSARDHEMVSLADYFSRVVYYVAASFRSTESEKTVKRPMGRPGKSARSKAMARLKKTRRTSR